MTKHNTAAPQPAPSDAVQWREEWVPLASIIKHGPLQVRHKLDAGAVKRYRDMTLAGKEPPPIKVGRLKDGALYLVDGWHRLEAGAVQTSASLESPGDDVLALVAELSEAEVRWEAARANLGHGVPLKTRELREVFRAFIKAGKHKTTRGGLMSYRDVGAALGHGHTTIRNWMMKDFPDTAARMGGPEHGNTQAEQPAAEVCSLAEEHCAEAIKAAQGTLRALPEMTPQHRHLVVERLRAVLAEAERLGLEAGEVEEAF